MSNLQYPKANSEGRREFVDMESALAFRDKVLQDFNPAGYGTVCHIDPTAEGPCVYWRIFSAG
jgi:hypothetical protein